MGFQGKPFQGKDLNVLTFFTSYARLLTVGGFVPCGRTPMPKISVNTNGGPGRAVGTLNTQTLMRMQRVARMEIAGVSDQQICKAEGFDYAALKYLRSLDEFRELRQDLLEGHLTEMDKALAGRVDILRQEVRQAVPAALRCLIDTVNQRKDLRTALAAAGEILDRDPDKVFLKSKDVNSSTQSGSVSLPDTLMQSVTNEADKVATSVKESIN